MRSAWRWAVSNPGAALLAVTSLAAGIGLNCALFSVVDAVLWRPLPVRAVEELADVYTSGSDGDTYATTSYPDYLDLKAQNTVFSDLAGHSAMFAALNLSDRSRLVLGEVVTGNYFDLLGVEAAMGRTLRPEDDELGAAPVVVVSHRFWQRDLDGSAEALGRSIRLRGELYSVVGVLPPRFTGMLPMLDPEIWLPVSRVNEVEPAGIQDVVPSPSGTNRLDRRGQRWLFIKGRLKQGATATGAQANLQVLMDQLAAAHPLSNKGRRISVVPTRQVRIHPEADRALIPVSVGLMAVSALVLLVACANVASVLLARAAARRREMSIRLALGASRWRLVRQLTTESLLLAGLGGVCGAGLGWALTRAASSLRPPVPVPIVVDLQLDHRVLIFTSAIAVLAGLVAGLAPALQSVRTTLLSDLRGEAPVARAAGRAWALRDVLAAAQVAVTFVLLVGAGLLVRSLIQEQRVDIGLRTAGVALLSTDLDLLGYDAARARRFFEDAQQRIAALPGVTDVALAERTPFSINFNQQEFYVPGRHQPGDRPDVIQVTRVSTEYFAALGVTILQGRGFSSADTPTSPGVVVINETMSRRYWPSGDAIGQRVHLRGPDGPAFEIVGISADHKVGRVSEAPQPYVHFARAQRPAPFATIVARTTQHADALLASMRKTLLEVEPTLVFLDNQTLASQVEATMLPVRIAAGLLSGVGGLALLLAAVGLYGAVAYSVAQRTREIGIRMAIGAQPGNVLTLILGQGLVMALVGTGAGCVMAGLAAHGLAAFLFTVSPIDPIAWGTAFAIVVGTAMLANLVPARRAARVQPSIALRNE